MKYKNNNDIQLLDNYGRSISYLRVSLTDQCNLKCDYCYGNRSMCTDSERHLTDEELIRIINIFSRLGIDKIRFTGGEPLIRKNVANLIDRVSSVSAINLIGLTTNGVLLEKLFDKLIIAGLNRLNVSLDTLQRDKFSRITGRDEFQRVLRGIYLALESDAFNRIKVNTVVMRSINDDELRAFAEWALNKNIDLRFIEFMPTADSGWNKSRFIGEDEMREIINLPLVPEKPDDISQGPARSYRMDKYPGRISFISALSRNFCNNCNRLRLTSSGELIGCLFGTQKVNISQLLRDCTNDDDIASYLCRTISKPEFRRNSDNCSVSFIQPNMRMVGG